VELYSFEQLRGTEIPEFLENESLTTEFAEIQMNFTMKNSVLEIFEPIGASAGDWRLYPAQNEFLQDFERVTSLGLMKLSEPVWDYHE